MSETLTPTRLDELDEMARAAQERAEMLTPVAGGHVFRGTWEALAELDTATCEACGEHIKQDGEPVDVVEHDGAGVGHRIMCDGWPASAAPGVLLLLARGMVREREAPDDVGDLLPARPSQEARAELYSAHWDASQPHADVKPPLFRIGKAFDALSAALSDEEHALRMALEHDERMRAAPAPPEHAPAELTADRLDELDEMARAAQERAAKATPGPWKADATQEDTPVVYRSLPDVGPKAAQVLFEADWGTEEDAAFAASAREDVPALTAALQAATAEIRRLREREAVLESERDHLGSTVDAWRRATGCETAEQIDPTVYLACGRSFNRAPTIPSLTDLGALVRDASAKLDAQPDAVHCAMDVADVRLKIARATKESPVESRQALLWCAAWALAAIREIDRATALASGEPPRAGEEQP